MLLLDYNDKLQKERKKKNSSSLCSAFLTWSKNLVKSVNHYPTLQNNAAKNET